MRRLVVILALLAVLAFISSSIGCEGKEVTPTPTPVPTSPALFLEITQPLDGAQVPTSAILVTGKTIPGAVVSALIDDKVEIADVDQSGNFTVAVNLEEGPNYIEVVASDYQGNEKSFTLAVVYIP